MKSRHVGLVPQTKTHQDTQCHKRNSLAGLPISFLDPVDTAYHTHRWEAYCSYRSCHHSCRRFHSPHQRTWKLKQTDLLCHLLFTRLRLAILHMFITYLPQHTELCISADCCVTRLLSDIRLSLSHKFCRESSRDALPRPLVTIEYQMTQCSEVQRWESYRLCTYRAQWQPGEVHGHWTLSEVFLFLSLSELDPSPCHLKHRS